MVKKKQKNTGASQTGRGGGSGKYTESLHPRDASGHFITTGGGIRRIQEGSALQRSKLAQQIRKARKTHGKNKAKRKQLAQKVKRMRVTRRSRGANPQGVNRRASPGQQHQPVHPDALPAYRKGVASNVEKSVARMTGGTVIKASRPVDVTVPTKTGVGEHAIEVKSKSFGAKETLSVHPNALYLKAMYAKNNPGTTYHTVLMDVRAKSEGGAHAASYSGHELYYKRGSGAYTVRSMYKVKDPAELNRLIHAKDSELPKAARGGLPKGQALRELKDKAIADKAYNEARGKAYKAKLGRAAYMRGVKTIDSQPSA